MINGVTIACLKIEGNLPPEKERLARCAMISEKTLLQHMMREVGMMSIVHDLAGEKLRIQVTSSAVTGATCPAQGHHRGEMTYR